MTCLMGERPPESWRRSAPTRLLLRMTLCVERTSSRSVGSRPTERLPATSGTLYCPPYLPPCVLRPVPTGKRSFGRFGARPELSTTVEELAKPVPFPLPTKSLPFATATAEGYCPTGMKPRTTERRASSPLRLTTATELLCTLAT